MQGTVAEINEWLMLCASSIKRALAPAQSNTIRSTAGLERLSALEELDLACNLLASVHEVACISGASHAAAYVPDATALQGKEPG